MTIHVSISKVVCVVTVIILHYKENEAARILAVIPTPSISHQVVFRPLFQELAKRGHEMTIVTTDPAFKTGKAPNNIKEIDLHDLSYEIWNKAMADYVKKREFIETDTFFNPIFEAQVESQNFQDILKKPNDYFDLIFIETVFRHYLVLAHFFKAPLIVVSSLGAINDHYEVIGAPTHPILSPSPMRQRLYNLTFWEKYNELYIHYKTKYSDYYKIKHEDLLIRKLFGPDVPSVEVLNTNVDMLFLNTHPIFDGNQPVPPSVLRIYGIYKKQEKKLPNDLKSYLDSSSQGVIYMSFGTNMDPSYLPRELIQIFVNVFTQLPYKILWKWNGDNVPSNAKNIKFQNWFPQSDVLRHPNIKLFITQGGLQSTEESINAGVPLIGIPMIGDQWYNTEKYKYLNIGEKLDFDTLDEDILRSTIDKVISNDSYRKTIQKLSHLLADEPETPLERAVWWTEYVIRHKGAKHLRSSYANISWWDYLELDFIIQLLALATSITLICVMVLYCLLKYVAFLFLKNNKLKKT